MRLSFIILCAAIGSVGAIPSGQETGYYEELLPRKAVPAADYQKTRARESLMENTTHFTTGGCK